ncbi:MAG TPA: PaaI family thioesterase [Prolixibacteraceae bacterium]|nr:PaaI family thioesterase [Prolixibacteraceae bacterium]
MESRIKKLEQLLKNDRFASHNDIRLISIGKGEAVAEMTVAEKHLNGVNIIQGGALFTLADFAFAAASNSHGRMAVAANASIHFFKGVSSGKLTAVAKELNSGKTLASYTVDIVDDQNTKIAFFSATAFLKGEY